MLSEKIKELREKFNISQSQLAKRLNVTRSSVNAWEMGLSTPSTQYVVDLAHIFHVSSDYLLGLSSKEVLSLENINEKEKKILYDLLDYFEQKYT